MGPILGIQQQKLLVSMAYMLLDKQNHENLFQKAAAWTEAQVNIYHFHEGDMNTQQLF